MDVNTLLAFLQGLQGFPTQEYIHRLFNKVIDMPNVSNFRDKLRPFTVEEEADNSPTINGVDASQQLGMIGERAIADALANVGSALDKSNLRSCIRTEVLEEVANEMFNQTSTLLFAEFIDDSLRKSNLPPLAELARDHGLALAFKHKLENKHFIKGVIRQDMGEQNHVYIMSLLFVMEYLFSGPGLMRYVDENICQAPCAELITIWAETMFEENSEDNVLAALSLSKAVSILHAVTVQGNVTPGSAAQHYEKLLNYNIVSVRASGAPDLDHVRELGDEGWKSMTSVNKESWTATENTWYSSVGFKAAHQTEYTQFTIQIPSNPERRTLYQNIIATGADVANWINEGVADRNFKGFFNGKAPSFEVVNGSYYGGDTSSGCFLAGTQVAVQGGSIPIEDVTEDTLVLTSQAPELYGLTSDEDVMHHPSPLVICGINGEKPFLPGHVFHTVSGLKAVNPVVAREENHWLEVGKLRPGHILYRLSQDRGEYEQVEIQSIHVEVLHDEKVPIYGIHLRGGYRSYHANGFLVAISIKSIARTLSTFPENVRVSMLMKINEIKPLLARFGAGAISDVLKDELRGLKRRPGSSPVVGKRRNVSLEMGLLTRSYEPQISENSAVPDYPVPRIKLHEGTLLLDGVAEPRSMINTKNSTARWTRKIPNGGYEHGCIKLVSHGMDGSGTILLSDDPYLGSILSDWKQRSVNFHLFKPKCPSLKTHEDEFAPTAQGLATPVPRFASDVSDDPWTLQVDRDEWKADEIKDEPRNAISLGDIILSTYHAGGAAGLSIPIAIIPVLDKLLNVINSVHFAGKAPITSLYTTTMNFGPAGTQIFSITLDKAHLLHQLADKTNKDGSLSSLFDVSFENNLKTDVKLPLLFHTITLQESADFGSMRGAALEYDPSKRGSDGKRHLVTDGPDSAPTSYLLSSGRKIWRTLAAARPTPITVPFTSASAYPAPVTSSINPTVALSVNNLLGFTYQSASVHEKSQTLLKEMMLYHMREGDRIELLQEAIPRTVIEIPELGANLQDSLKTWLRDEYAQAYVSYMISQVDSSAAKWRHPFDDAEKDKLWYWWTGKGEKCLSQSSQYVQLNDLSSRYAMRREYSENLEPYIDDGGPKWAKFAYERVLNNEHVRNQLCGQKDGIYVALNKYCNVLNVLDPESDYAGKIFKMIMNLIASKNLKSSRLPNSGEQADKEQTWMIDAMKTLIQMVLENSPELGSKLKDMLLQALQKLGLDESKSHAEQAQEAAAKWEEFMNTLKNFWGYAKQGPKGFGWVAISANWVARKMGKFPFGKGFALLAGVAVNVWVAYSAFKDWDQLSDAKRAIAVTSALSFVCDAVEKSIDFYKEVSQWRQGSSEADDYLSPEEACNAEALDQALIGELESPEGAESMNQISEDVYDYDLRDTWFHTITSEEQPTQAVDLGGDTPEETLPGRELGPEEALPPEYLPPSARGSWSKFAIAENVLKGVNLLVNVAFTVAMCVDLRDNWDKLTDANKALSVLQIVIQGLTVMVDAAAMIGGVLAEAGLMAADCTVLVVVPILGPILAVIGIVIIAVLMGISKNKEPEKSPVEKFLDSLGHPLVKGFDTPPSIKLTWMAEQALHEGSETTFRLTAKNAGTEAVTLTRAEANVNVGEDSAALFSQPTAPWTKEDDSTKVTKPGTVGAGTAGQVVTTLTNQVRNYVDNDKHTQELRQYRLQVKGKGKTGLGTSLILEPGESVLTAWMGTVNKKGKSLIQVVETTLADSTRKLISVERTG